MAAAKNSQAKKPASRRGKPLPAELREAIVRDLLGAEQPRQNAIAKAHGVSPATVAKIAREEGVTFDRSSTQKATEARSADVESRLVRAQAEVLDIYDLIRAKVFAGQREYAFEAGMGDSRHLVRETIDIDPRDYRELATAIGIMLDKAMALRKELRGDGAPESAFEAFLAFIGGTPPDDVESAEAG